MRTGEQDRITVTVAGADSADTLDGIREGLLGSPREISSRYFYDDLGSRLFEMICDLPEYYQTRTERQILSQVADRIAKVTAAREVVELGSGAATKTRVLLDALTRGGTLRRYVPLDVSEGILRRVSEELVEEYPHLEVHGVVADFIEDLDRVPEREKQLVVFLGGTIGNLTPEHTARFLEQVRSRLSAGGHLLLGADLIKDKARLERAYNDAAGVTEEFNLNILRVLNRLLGGDFVPDAFEHVAFYNEAEHRIEMWLRSSRDQTVHLPGIDLELSLRRGEEIRTEISTKFSRELVTEMLEKSGFSLLEMYTDPDRLFGLFLARKTAG
jgi:L-histidine N-alpha-methyltransferase